MRAAKVEKENKQTFDIPPLILLYFTKILVNIEIPKITE
jgi:hypothetical protein